jgi:hypothetical protein
LHHVRIIIYNYVLFTIKVTDGLNPANVYTTSFTNLSSYGGQIGPAALAGAEGMFDNFSITAAPEPAGFGLGAAGFAWLVASKKRPRRQLAKAHVAWTES